MSAAVFVHLNGRLVPVEEACISPFDRGFLRGDGMFETLRAYGGRFFCLDEHLARLANSCRIARIPLPDDLPDRMRAVLDANALSDASVRVTVTRGVGGAGVSARGSGPPTVLVTAAPVAVPRETYERGLAVATAARRRIAPDALEPSMKTTNYLVNVLARIEAEEAGADDALFLDDAGHVVETTQANVFAVFGDRLVTPPLATGCLAGVTRAVVLRLAPDAGLAPQETPLSLADARAADELLLTGSVTEVAPIVRLDGAPIGDGRPGPLTQRLHALYRNLATSVR